MLLRDLDILSVDYTAAKESYRRTEVHNVSDLNGYFLIPFEGPMYVRNLVVRADGAILTIEKDYTIEDDFVQLELMTGKKVIGSLRIKDHIVKDYKEIKIAYQKVGEFTVSRAFLLNSAEVILHNPKPIDWLTQVFGKPETYPPAFHTHDISSSDEMVGFSDLLLLFKQASGQTRLHGLDLWKKLKSIETVAYKTLGDNYEALWNKMFTHVMNVNVPHLMTKADIELGNHPNYGTATLVEDTNASYYTYNQTDTSGQLILKTDKISTPKGVHAAIDNYDTDTDGYVRQGSLPFSYYGSGFYLPPPISGSFEGLGTNTGGNAFCIEPNGYTVLLTRGFDSKVRSLYYYSNRNIYDSAEQFIFSGFTYKSQLMENNGHTPNHILSGSSGRVLVIGDKEAGEYYICLANGTLDANSHQLMKINMGSFRDDDGVYMWHPDKAYVMLVGDYVYIIATVDSWAPTIPENERFGLPTSRRTSFYRVDASSLTGDQSKEVNFTKQMMTYTDVEGGKHNNTPFVDIAKNVVEVDSNGNKVLKRCVYGYDTPPTRAGLGNPWRCQWFNQEDPEHKNCAAIKMFHNTRWEYEGTAKLSGDWWFCIPLYFDANSNTITVDPSFFKVSRDLITGKTTVPEGKNVNDWYHGNISAYCAGHAEVAATFIPKLGYIACRTNNYTLPYNVAIAFMGYNPKASGYLADSQSDWEIFNQPLRNLVGNGYRQTNIPLDSPFGFTTKPCLQRDLWEYNGNVNALPVEIFYALDRNGTKTLWARQAKDNYNYATGSMFNFKYINSTVIGRTASTMFMSGEVGNLSTAFSSRMPVVNVGTKDRHSVQYGIVNIHSPSWVEDRHVIPGGLYYSDVSGTAITVHAQQGNFYVGLLGKHTVDIEGKKITVEKVLSDSIYVQRSVWLGLVKQMLGTKFSLIANEKGGSGSNGEYLLTLYFGSKPDSGNDVFPSMAMLTYHYLSDPSKTYGIFATFNWSISSTQPTAEKVININNIKYPIEKFGFGKEALISDRLNYTPNGKWSSADQGYGSEALNAELHMEFTDQNNYEFWLSSGINQPVPLNAANSVAYGKIENGVATSSAYMAYQSIYNVGGLSAHWQYVTDLGMTRPLSGSTSGGAALYVQGGRIPSGQIALMQAVFIEGNWTLFVNNDITVLFNGSEKTLLKTNYDLSTLGINQKSRVFYLYAVCGKTQGYYDLSVSEKTASPYHILVAVIKTNAFGIETIEVNQVFAISGFSVTALNKGGSIPATTGTFPEYGTFEAITDKDLFDTSNY